MLMTLRHERSSFPSYQLLTLLQSFIFADSSVVSTLAAFNPYSLLHIPLYGILTVLLIFSFMPLKFNFNQLTQETQQTQ